MFTLRLRSRRCICSSFSLTRCGGIYSSYIYTFLIVLALASVISYYQPFGLLYHIRRISFTYSSEGSAQARLIDQHKQKQMVAYEWLKNLSMNSKEYPNLISDRTHQSRFYDYLQLPTNLSSSYSLLQRPKSIGLDTDEHILISILYGRDQTDHNPGKFYIGQVLHHLLRNHHPRFIITLCENDNSHEKISEGVELIRRLLPVFLVSNISTPFINIYEREKNAHLHCILANFQSFPKIKYFLLLQDDAEPTNEDFYFRLSSLIDQRIARQWPANGNRKLPGFIKIYHPRWLIGYMHPSFYIIFQLLATSLLLTSVAFACIHLRTTSRQGTDNRTKRSTSVPSQPRWRNNSVGSLTTSLEVLSYLIQSYPHVWNFSYCFLLTTLVLILLNHTNISWPWRSLHPSLYALHAAPSCCLPGVLFFRPTYLEVTNYLQSIQCTSKYAIDTALDDLSKRTGLQTFLVEPNLVHHIGLFSRLRQIHVSPYLLD